MGDTKPHYCRKAELRPDMAGDPGKPFLRRSTLTAQEEAEHQQSNACCQKISKVQHLRPAIVIFCIDIVNIAVDPVILLYGLFPHCQIDPGVDHALLGREVGIAGNIPLLRILIDAAGNAAMGIGVDLLTVFINVYLISLEGQVEIIALRQFGCVFQFQQADVGIAFLSASAGYAVQEVIVLFVSRVR